MNRPPDAAFWALPPAAAGAGLAGRLGLGVVTRVDDPEDLARIEVRLLGLPEQDGQPTHAWAQVLVPFAGANYGAWLVPGVDETVVLGFLDHDARRPIVLGALWHGQARPADGPRNAAIRSWELRGRDGTRLSLVEDNGSRVELLTAQGVSLTLDDQAGGRCQLDCAGTTITVDTQGVRIETPGQIQANASTVRVSASMVNVDAALAQFSGVVKCEVLQTSSVISSSYTPGAGNIW